MDINNFICYSEKNKEINNKIIKNCNDQIDGRVCVSSWLHYLLSLKKYLGKECKTYVETGTLWGGSICCLLMLDNIDCDSDVNTHYIGIDLFEGYYGKNCKKNDWNKTSIDIDDKNHLQHTNNNISIFNKENNEISLIKGSSYDDNTVNKFKQITNCIDLLFIDGDHSEEGVTADFMKYNMFVRKGGFILFDNYGQPKIWDGVKKGVDSINFDKFGFNIVGQLGYSFLIQKLSDTYEVYNNNDNDNDNDNDNNKIINNLENTIQKNNKINNFEENMYQLINEMEEIKHISGHQVLEIRDIIKEIGFRFSLGEISRELAIDQLKEITFDYVSLNKGDSISKSQIKNLFNKISY